MSVNFPINANFSGTVSAPLFVSNQVLIAPVAAGTTSTLTVGSFSATFLSVSASITSASLFTSTLSVSTILNFSAGGSLGTNLVLSGTLTSASLSTTFSSITTLYSATITAGTVLNLPGANVINFGSDQSKAVYAGNIGYQLSTPGSLDVYGAGAIVGARNVKIWDNMIVAGTITSSAEITGTITGTLARFGTVGGTTLAITGTGAVATLSVGGASGGSASGVVVNMPTLTSNTGGGFTVSASSLYDTSGTYAPWKAFDTNNSTDWLCAQSTYATGGTGSTGAYVGTVTTSSTKGEYLQVMTPAPYQLQSYTLFGYSTHPLNDFAIMGSSDGTSYTTIDTRSGQNCTTAQTFTAPAQTQAFSYFRLIIIRDVSTEASTYTVVSTFTPVFVTLGAAYQVDVSGPSRVTGAFDVIGSITATGNITAFNSTSDKRLKNNITTMRVPSETIDALRAVDFTWRDDLYHEPMRGKQDIGLIAQEVSKTFPLAHGTKQVFGQVIETVDYMKLIPLLLAEIQDMRKRIRQLESV